MLFCEAKRKKFLQVIDQLSRLQNADDDFQTPVRYNGVTVSERDTVGIRYNVVAAASGREHCTNA